jgi:putative ABC transport system permease protein
VIGVALRGLLGRKLRAVLTALAIVLGVTMVSGTFVLTDTINKAFNNIFQGTYAHTDAVVSGKAVDINVQGDTAATPSIPENLLEKVRGLPDVAAATGGVGDDHGALIVKKNGKVVDSGGAPAFAFGMDYSQPRFNPHKLVDGRWPTASDEVVIDASTAADQGYKLGDTVRIATLQPVRPFQLVGIAQWGDVKSLGSATFADFTLPAAQELLERPGKLDAIDIAAKPGVSPQKLVQEVRPVLPASAQVRTGAQQATEDLKSVSFTKFIRYFLLGFAGVALFVGAFVIFNTLSITVAQRTREFATLRTIGGSRRQVLWSVVTEAFVIGLLASFIGLFLGLGLAAGLNALFKALNMDLPTQGLVFAPRTIIVSLLIGTIVTVVAGIFPGIRATKVPPIAAVREGFVLPKGRMARIAPYIAIVIITLSVALLSYSLFKHGMGTAQRLISMAVGVLALFVGVAMISSRLVKPLAAFVGWPATRIGGAAGRLAKGNSTRNPGRTASTAAALMIGIALVTFVAVLANGMKSSNTDAIKQQVKAEYVLTAQDGFSPFVPSAGDAVGRASDAQFSTSVRSGLGKALGESGYITGIQPSAIAQAYTFKWKEGSDAILSQMGRNGTIVAKDFANNKHLKLGDKFTLLTPNGDKTQLVVKGIYEPPPFFPILGEVSITQSLFDSLYERPENSFVFVDVAGEPTPATTASLEAAVKDFPDAKVQTRDGWIKQQNKDFNDFLSMLYVLLALSVVVSIFGLVNTLVLSVFERTRELGMLRAVGMTRRQARRMIRHESVITALIGAALGLPLGIFLALLMTRALSQFNVQIAIPYKNLLLFALVAVIVGMFAAIFPARRAARLNVLRALQYE